MKIESKKPNEIDLLKLVRILKERIFFIIFITVSGTLAAFLYLSTLVPTYTTSALITSISVDSEERLNQIIKKNALGHEVSSHNLINDFLIYIQSENFQQKALNEFDYSNLLDVQKDKNEHELEIKSLLNSINVSIFKTNSFLGDVYQISIEGKNPNLIASYINDLIKFSNKEVLSQLEDRIRLSIKNRIDALNYEISSLKIKDANYNLALIDELEQELEIAKNLGIKEPKTETTNTITAFPYSYLLGENAIKEKIRQTKNKTSNYSKSIEIVDLKDEIDFLENIKINLDGYNAINTIMSGKISNSPSWPNSRLFLLFAFFASFLGSIVLSLFHDLLKQDSINQ